MGQTHTFNIGDDTVEFSDEELRDLIQGYINYCKDNPDLSRDDQLGYLKGLFTPYIVA
tara:strand:+ start:108 stop:281 length:174 start_codon:yes stop_codon:yes gene_type:complete